MAAATARAMLLFVAAGAFVLAAGAADDHNNKKNGDGGELATKKGLELVTQVCTNASWYYTRPDRNMTREYCESTLRSDKRSASAESRRDLVLIALDLLQHAAEDADAKAVDGAKKKKQSGGDFETKVTLEYCRADYSAMARTIPVCRDIVQRYNDSDGDVFGFGGDYVICTYRLRNTGYDWWNMVRNNLDGSTKLVGKQVEEVYRRTVLVSAMVEQMLRFIDNEFDDK